MVILFVFFGLSGLLTFNDPDIGLSNPILYINIQTFFIESEAVRNIARKPFSTCQVW